MAGNDGLPEGWEMSIDENTGRTFYINHETMQTSWTPPVEEPLPPNWSMERDSEGRIFFINHETQTTQWEDPRLSLDVGGEPSGADVHNMSYPSLGDEQNSFSNSNTAQSTNGKWSCSHCTLENEPSSSTCAACGAERGGGSSQSPNSRRSGGFPDDGMDAATAAAIEAAQAEDAEFLGESMENIREVIDPRDLDPYVVPDEHSMVCTLCGKPFDWANRKHHCRCSGGLYCQSCSSRKATFSLKGEKPKERRVCDICFDHQSAGDRHCYLRYIGILRDAGSLRRSDRMLAFKGVAEMIERIKDSISDSASFDDQANALRTNDGIERCGGAATLCELLSPDDDPQVQIQSCRVIASMAEVAALSPPDSRAPLSMESVCGALSDGSHAMASIQKMLSRDSTPWEAHVHLAHALYLLGGRFEIQEAVRTMRVLPPLCDALLASQQQLQMWATLAVSRLVKGNIKNVEAMLDANGMQALIILLNSDDAGVKENAAAAICSGLELENRGRDGPRLVSRVRDAIANLGGTTAAVQLLSSENPAIAQSGLHLITNLSNGQAEVVRAAGAIPLVIALLANQDPSIQASAAQLLRNVALCSMAGTVEVLESGGLSMAIPLLSSGDPKTKGNAAALCEAFASDEKGSQLLIESNAIPSLVSLVRFPDDAIRSHAAGALVQLLQNGQHEKEIVVNAGGVEALLALEDSSDPAVVRQLVGAVYSFVSDEHLLETLTRRIAPSTMAMKLLGLLGGRNASHLDSHTKEMLILVVAVLCGARDGDQFKDDVNDIESEAPSASETQTRDLVASNGASLVLPLLSSSQHQPALVLAVFRLLLAVCKSPNGATTVAKAGGVSAVVRALDDSLNVEGNSSESYQLVYNLRQYGITLFGKLCGNSLGRGGESTTLTEASTDDVRHGVRAITRVLEQGISSASTTEKLSMQRSVVRALRNLSFQSGNWETIASHSLPQLIEILLSDDADPTLLSDIAIIISNLAKLEKHCDMVLDAGAVFALLGLLEEKESDAVEAGIITLTALGESSKRCRLAIVDQGAGPKLLHIAEQRSDPLPLVALRCLLVLAQEAANSSKITAESGATDALLRLMKNPEGAVAEQALEILLVVAKDSETLWEQLVLNADVDSSIALLKLGPPRVQGQACSTLAALCGDSPGFALCSSPKVVEVLPVIVKLLSPPEHLGSDKSESPAKEAAAACALLSEATSARIALLDAGVIPALVTLLLRERRLGRPRSATSEHTLNALFSFSSHDSLDGDMDSDDCNRPALWTEIEEIGKRRDTIDSIITILDAHIRDTLPTPSGRDRYELCENAIVLLGKLPQGLSPNEITLLGRSSRSINMLVGESCPETLMKACLKTLGRICQESSLVSVVTAAGTIRSCSTMLEPLLADGENSQSIDTDIVLQAAGLIANLVKFAKDRSIDDAVIGTKAIPALAAMLTRTDELFPAREHSERALTTGLEAISSLSKGGPAIQKSIMSSGNHVVSALAQVVVRFTAVAKEEDEEQSRVNTKRAKYALITLSRLGTIGENRDAIAESEPGILKICQSIFMSSAEDSSDEERELIYTAAEFVRDLGPVALRHAPDICEYIAAEILPEEELAKGWKPALEALLVFTMDASQVAILLGIDLLENLAFILKSCQEDKDLQRVSSLILRHVCQCEALRDKDESYADQAFGLCAGFLNNHDNHDTVTVFNALTALRSLVLVPSICQKISKTQMLMKSIRAIGTSGDSETILAVEAASIFSLVGAGETLKQASKPKPTAVPRPPQPKPKSAASPPHRPASVTSAATSVTRQNGFTNKSLQPPPPPPPPSSISSRSNSGSSSRQSLPRTSPLMAPSTRGPPPPPMQSGTLLPTFSKSVGSRNLKKAPNSDSSHTGTSPNTERASLELAMKLQAEEEQRSKSSSSQQPKTPPPSSHTSNSSSNGNWSCSACTFENSPSNQQCEICGTAKPNSNRFSSGGDIIRVRCPSCQKILGAPSGASIFECMSCHQRSSVQTNKI